jgi:hypothetical protein
MPTVWPCLRPAKRGERILLPPDCECEALLPSRFEWKRERFEMRERREVPERLPGLVEGEAAVTAGAGGWWY